MAFQYETGSGSDRATGYRDMLSKIVAMATSKHVSAVVINAGGTGYVNGEIVTLTHAGAYLDAKFEVTAAAGVITGLRILANGAFSNRAASATVSAGGSGYANGNIIEVQGGTNREKAKFTATTSAGAVTSVALFETGGSYSSTPSNPASTTKIGPTAGTGSGCTLTVTYTGLIGTTGLALTGGSGTGATVNITLTDTGWTAERNTNSSTFNSLTDEKQVVLKGDAAGLTNKPYIGFCTLTATSGLNTRYAISLHGMTSHNSGTAMSAQPGLLGDPGTFSTSFPYLLCDENDLQDMDFWISLDDKRISGVLDTNSGAATSDDSQYHHWYAGYYESFATEIEDPYPLFVGASGRQYNIDPSASSVHISGLSECYRDDSNNTGFWFYLSEDSAWTNVANTTSGLTTTTRGIAMFPMCLASSKATAFVSDGIADNGPIEFASTVGSIGRAVSSRRLGMIPGTTPYHYPIPLTLLHRSQGSPQGANTDTTDDTLRGTLANWYWVFNSDSSMATITAFAEDYITIGSDRYRVFHTHVQRQLYHYVCLKESV